MAYERLSGALALASNTPGIGTGYGVQAQYLIDRLTRHGIDTAVFSNYGLEGSRSWIKTPHGRVAHYPKGQTPHSVDVIQPWFTDFMADKLDKRRALMTLYDVWIYNNVEFDGDVISWVPLDSVTMPPEVKRWLQRDQVTPIAMSPHGQRQIKEEFDIEAAYIPHAVDTSVFKPTQKMFGKKTRRVLGIGDDDFLVSIVAANKSNGMIHRKALAEQILAFSLFRKDHPDAYLYLHMTPSNRFGGFRLDVLLKACGVPAEAVIIADDDKLRVGYDQKDLAALYTASDVLLSASLGEGFGVPIVEAQACGTPAIVGSWTAMPDLAGPSSLLVTGQPFWNNHQAAWWTVPSIDSILSALKQVYDRDRGQDDQAIEFASQFALERVWSWYWMPFLREYFGA